MAFSKMSKTSFPPRQWALVGYPGDGKSTFATQMRTPILPIDADHRFSEVAHHAAGEVYKLSNNPADNVNAEKIAAALKANMADSGVNTVVVDSLTSILSPLVAQAILDNDAGRNKNRVSAFKDKALAMRLLQDVITGWGCDVLWIYHLRDVRDAQAVEKKGTTSISAVELARLRRSLNMQLKVITKGAKRGILVEWARRGRSGIELWDESGKWAGFPERIEQAVYGGLTVEDMERIEGEDPTSFASVAIAIAWGDEKGCFNDAMHTQNAYDELKREKQPKTAQEMWSLWIAEVNKRVAERNAPPVETAEELFQPA